MDEGNEGLISGAADQNNVAVAHNGNGGAVELLPGFKPDSIDSLYSIALFALAYIFGKYILYEWQGFIVTLFSLAFLACQTAYFRRRGFALTPYSLFWLISAALASISFSMFYGQASQAARPLFLIFAVSYYTASATGSLASGVNNELRDIAHAFILTPFANFLNLAKSLIALLGTEKQRGKNIFRVIGGIALAILMLAIISPFLFRADMGGFWGIYKNLSNLIKIDKFSFDDLGWVALAIIIGSYWFGMISGFAYKRHVGDLSDKQISGILPAVTVNIMEVAVIAWHSLFIASQLPYFFNAFIAKLPSESLTYSEYARKGFFDLISVAFINIGIIALSTRMGKKEQGRGLTKILNVALVVISYIFLITAFSKMALYISAYGYTQLRVVASAVMIYLALLLAIALTVQRKDFPALKTAMVAAAAFVLFFSAFNIDKWVVTKNTDRYLSSFLNRGNFDYTLFSEGGHAGVDSAIKVLESALVEKANLNSFEANTAKQYLEHSLNYEANLKWYSRNFEGIANSSKIFKFAEKYSKQVEIFGMKNSYIIMLTNNY